ncbi:hypothetical protein HOLleu_05891 [Holothuria leucospilota]|uniref:Uncharacterized protein n=1 Tax=Holothuria leucospilota TaxID=206669 RepID=A0A9Q1CLM9_HOLLE|nr:hypothetical protein HOLleu_05891 [Holothuria leucospilota]
MRPLTLSSNRRSPRRQQTCRQELTEENLTKGKKYARVEMLRLAGHLDKAGNILSDQLHVLGSCAVSYCCTFILERLTREWMHHGSPGFLQMSGFCFGLGFFSFAVPVSTYFKRSYWLWILTWRRGTRDHDGGALRWGLFYSASLERDHCRVVSVKSKFVPWGRCYSFREQNSFGSIVWFSPLALRQRVRGLLKKKSSMLPWRWSIRDHDGGAPRWDLFYSASLERDHCQVVSVKSKLVSWGRCYSFREQNSFGSIVWFSPLALLQRVRGLLEKNYWL